MRWADGLVMCAIMILVGLLGYGAAWWVYLLLTGARIGHGG